MRFVGFLAKRPKRPGSKEQQTGGRNIESLTCPLVSCYRKGFKRFAGAARATVYKHFALRKMSLQMLSIGGTDPLFRL